MSPIDPLPSPPESGFARLLPELAALVLSHLSFTEILGVRGVSRAWSRHTVVPLLPYLGFKLKRLRVLTTQEALLTLHGLLQIPEWRGLVESVEFMDHGLYTLRSEKLYRDTRATQRWIGYFRVLAPQLEIMHNAIIPAQYHFETSGAALELLTNIFDELQEAIQLRAVYLDVDCEASGHITGLRRLLRSIGFPNANIAWVESKFDLQLQQEDTGAQFMPISIHLVYEGVKNSGFSKRVVHARLRQRNFKSANGDFFAVENWTFPEIWPALGHRCLQSLTIRNLAHKSKPHRPSPQTVSAEELTVGGCASSDHCHVCVSSIRTLEMTTFPNLTQLVLYQFVSNERTLAGILRPLKLHSITLANYRLTSGAWHTIFRLVKDMLDISTLNFKDLFEPLPLPSVRRAQGDVYMQKGRFHDCKPRVRIADSTDAAAYLKMLVSNHRVLEDAPLDRHGAVGFLRAPYADHDSTLWHIELFGAPERHAR